MRILYEFSASLIQIQDIDELLWHVARQVVGQLGFEDCVIYLVDDDAQNLVQMAAIGDKNPTECEIRNRMVIPVGKGVTGRVARSGQPLLLDDTRTEADYIHDTIEGVSELCVPILHDGEVFGVIDSEDQRSGFYQQQHLRFLESVASLLGAKIQQIRLATDLHRAERERAALLEIASMHTKYLEREPYFERFQQILTDMIPLDRITVALHTKGNDAIELPLHYEQSVLLVNQSEPLRSASAPNLVAWLLQQTESRFLRREDYRRLVEKGVLEAADTDPGTVLGVLYALNDRTQGLLIVSSRDDSHKPVRRDLGFLTLVCRSLSDAYRFEQSRIRRARAEKELAISESRFRSIIENAPFSVSLKSLDGRYLAVGSEFCRLNDVSPEDVIGQRQVPGVDEAVARRVFDLEDYVMREKCVAEIELEDTGKDGRTQSLTLTKFPVLDDNGNLFAVGGFGVDTTNQRQTEKQLMQAQRLEVVGQLTGGIAHDFNNLLMAISGGVERAQDMAHDRDDLKPVLDLIRKGAERGADLTRRLSIFSRMQVFDHEPADVAELVNGAANLIKHAIGSSIHLEVTTEDELWNAATDQGFFEHALLNLAINARDAMPDGGHLLIETRNAAVEPGWSHEVNAGDYVRISVSDTGTGMPDDVRAKIFEPFFTTKEVGKGSGLGLSMVFGFVKQSGGYIDLRSEVGKGTTIDLYLPRTTETPVAPPQDQPEPDSLDENGARILVVEDESSIRELLHHFLADSGHDATIVSDGRSALDVLKQQEPAFDLLITDVALPLGMDGREVAAEFLATNGGGEVIYISGYAEDSIIQKGRLDDGHTFLAKPFTRDSLTSKIAEVLAL
ncbi:MAG: ATP-binding protein [Pseudomonadota bacterium]